VQRLTAKQLWKVDSNGEDRKVTYLSTLVKHTQAVNVVRWSPRGAFAAISKATKTHANMTKVKSSPAPATTATCCFGCHLRIRQTHTTLKRVWKTRNHGESGPCAGPLDPRSMILPGLQTACTSSQAAWTMLLASTTPKQVRPTAHNSRAQLLKHPQELLYGKLLSTTTMCKV
jgi:hypothetical protein